MKLNWKHIAWIDFSIVRERSRDPGADVATISFGVDADQSGKSRADFDWIDSGIVRERPRDPGADFAWISFGVDADQSVKGQILPGST